MIAVDEAPVVDSVQDDEEAAVAANDCECFAADELNFEVLAINEEEEDEEAAVAVALVKNSDEASFSNSSKAIHQSHDGVQRETMKEREAPWSVERNPGAHWTAALSHSSRPDGIKLKPDRCVAAINSNGNSPVRKLDGGAFQPWATFGLYAKSRPKVAGFCKSYHF